MDAIEETVHKIFRHFGIQGDVSEAYPADFASVYEVIKHNLTEGSHVTLRDDGYSYIISAITELYRITLGSYRGKLNDESVYRTIKSNILWLLECQNRPVNTPMWNGESVKIDAGSAKHEIMRLGDDQEETVDFDTILMDSGNTYVCVEGELYDVDRVGGKKVVAYLVEKKSIETVYGLISSKYRFWKLGSLVHWEGKIFTIYDVVKHIIEYSNRMKVVLRLRAIDIDGMEVLDNIVKSVAVYNCSEAVDKFNLQELGKCIKYSGVVVHEYDVLTHIAEGLDIEHALAKAYLEMFILRGYGKDDIKKHLEMLANTNAAGTELKNPDRFLGQYIQSYARSISDGMEITDELVNKFAAVIQPKIDKIKEN